MDKRTLVESTERTVSDMIEALTLSDSVVQTAEVRIKAMVEAIRLLLAQPDAIHRRGHMLAFCDAIEHQIEDAMNVVNGEAEKFGANYVNEAERDFVAKVFSNVRLQAHEPGLQ